MKSNKKRLATMSLGAMMLASGLTGCKEKTNTVDLTEDITTEITTENVLTTETVDLEEERAKTRESQYKTLAENSYNTYKEFYDDISVSSSQIEKLVKILNEDLSGITTDDARDAYALIDQIILSDNMHHQIDKYIFSPDSTDIPVYAHPRISEFISNDSADLKEFLIRAENLRDEIYNAYTIGTEEDRKVATEDAAKLVDYEAIQYRHSGSIMNDNTLSSPKRMLASNYEKNIIGMLNSISVNQPEMESSEGFTIYLVSNVSVSVDENGEKVYDYTGTDDVAFSDGKELRELLAKCEQGKYIETCCSELASIIKQIQENNLTQSRRELKDMYEAKKNLLSQMKQDSYKSICSNVENEINSKSYGYSISING